MPFASRKSSGELRSRRFALTGLAASNRVPISEKPFINRVPLLGRRCDGYSPWPLDLGGVVINIDEPHAKAGETFRTTSTLGTARTVKLAVTACEKLPPDARHSSDKSARSGSKY
jgi:hypothetical protein